MASPTFIKCDFSKFCDEDDPEYNGDVSMAGMDEMGGPGGMGFGGQPPSGFYRSPAGPH